MRITSVPAPFTFAPMLFKKLAKVHDMGLLGRIIDDRRALCLSRSQHNVDRAAHRDHIEEHVAASQLLGLCLNHAAQLFGRPHPD